MQRVIATIGGLIAGGVTVMIIEMISQFMHPMPEGLDISDRDALTEWMQNLPVTAYLMVVQAWCVGSFVGAAVARLFSHRSLLPSLIVMALLEAGTLFNLITLPHPLWMWPVGLAGMFVCGILGMLLASPRSYVVSSSHLIAAPQETVFQRLANIEQFTQAVPHITKVEFLSEQKYGVGTEFRETRVMNGREATATLKVTELVENESLRIISDEGGTEWDTKFQVSAQDGQTQMDMEMEARPQKRVAKFLTPLILPMVEKFVIQDMELVKSYCEEKSAQDALH